MEAIIFWDALKVAAAIKEEGFVALSVPIKYAVTLCRGGWFCFITALSYSVN